MRHCVLDLESLGLNPGCVILSIGAVAFDDSAPEMGFQQFKVNVDRASGEALGMHVDASTEEWWSNQSAAARGALLDPEPIGLTLALSQFTDFYVLSEAERIWSHGAATDIPWLQMAYVAAGLNVPWHYREPRDTRTLFDLVPHLKRHKPEVEHCALSDATACARDIYQALWYVNKGSMGS